jgi:transmembrane sensor
VTRWSKVLTTQDDEETLDASWRRVQARRARPRFVRRAMVAAPIVAVAALLLLLLRTWLAPAPPVTPVAAFAPPVVLAPIALAGGAALPAEWTAPSRLVVPLDDGSRLELAPQTLVKSGQGASDRVELAVESGRATFDVKPNGPRTWVINAGPVVVKVLGTRFTVARTGNVVEVTVERGKVEVTGAGGTQVLVAGQRFASAKADADAEADAKAEAKAEAKAKAKAEAEAKAIALAPAPASASAPAPAPASALAPASAPAPASASALASASAPPDPLSHADALRRSGKPSDAVTVLREVAATSDRRAPLAAFTIGKIHAEDLHDAAGGARWFERAISLGLPSGLDEEAHARAVECFARAGSRAEAARAARRYEARFPEGRHLARVKEWSRD